MHPNLHILLVEDNPGDADLIQEILTDSVSMKFVFTQADRLEEAFQVLENTQVDLILLDLGLPESTGLETVKKMYAMAESVPIVILTGHDDRQLAIEAVKAGAQDYLVKGKIALDVFERVIRYSLERHRYRQRVKESEQFLRTTLDALSAHIAILDHTGRILNVNKAWIDFARENDTHFETIREGANYFEICEAVTGEDVETAATAVAGIRAVINGERDAFQIEYPCHSPTEQRWFHLRATPFPGTSKRQVVVAHENITARKQAEEARHKSEGIFEKIFEMVPLGLWLIDGKGNIVRGNPEGIRIWGSNALIPAEDYGRFKVRRLPSGEKIAPDDLSMVQTIKKGVTITDELLEMEAFDGVTRTILSCSAPLWDEQGKVEGAVVANLDLSKRRKTEEALMASENRIRLVFDTSPNCLFIKDRLGRYMMVNESTARLFNTTCAAMIGKSDKELAVGGWSQRNTESWSPLNLEDPDHSVQHTTEESFIRVDGAICWFRMFRSPIAFADVPDCELTIAVDITLQREAREKLRSSELLMRTILDTLTSRVILMDRDLRVIWVNRAAIDFAKKTSNQVIGLHCYDTFHHHDGICQNCPAIEAIKEGRLSKQVKKTSQGRTWVTYAIPIRNDLDDIANVVEVADDITDRLFLEGQLRQAQKMESLGTLAGGIAHDFNNILSGILGYTELAQMKAEENPTLKGYLHEVYSAGLRATDLVRQILTFSRRRSAELQPLQVPLVVKEALKLLRSTLPTTVELKTLIAREVDPVLADPTQIHQIIMNLCTNASHAMEPDGGVLTVTIEQVTPEPLFFEQHPDLIVGSYLRLQVSDTGCGMPPAILSSIFDPYFTTKDLGEGTGLGLSVVHGIVKEYGGEILVDSAPEQGSTFTILLPVTSKAVFDLKAENQSQILAGSEHILLVDDEPILCEVYKRFLEHYGYRVTTFNDPLKALDSFKADPMAVDLVLSDVAMPRMSGEKMGQHMHTLRPELPIILMTGFSQHLTEELAKDQGFEELLIKPLAKNSLLIKLREIFTNSQKH